MDLTFSVQGKKKSKKLPQFIQTDGGNSTKQTRNFSLLISFLQFTIKRVMQPSTSHYFRVTFSTISLLPHSIS